MSPGTAIIPLSQGALGMVATQPPEPLGVKPAAHASGGMPGAWQPPSTALKPASHPASAGPAAGAASWHAVRSAPATAPREATGPRAHHPENHQDRHEHHPPPTAEIIQPSTLGVILAKWLFIVKVPGP